LTEHARHGQGSSTENGTSLGSLDASRLRRMIEIGQQLFLSVRTVETHRAHIQQKTRLSTRAELVHYAIEHGLIST